MTRTISCSAAAGLRDEVQREHRQCPVERVGWEWERQRIADLEPAAHVLSRVPHVGRRPLDARHLHRVDRRGRSGQRAGARSDVEHAIALGDARERHEQWREPTAPAAHEPLVAVAFGEHPGVRLSPRA